MAGFSRRINSLRWRARLVTDLFRGERGRHRALAGWAALEKRRTWRRRAAAMHQMHPPKRTVLVGLVEHLGDIVACEPISRHLRHERPDAHIVWAVRRPYRGLLEHNPHVDEIITVRCLTEWMHLVSGNPVDQVFDLHVPGKKCLICGMEHRRPDKRDNINASNYYRFGNLLEIGCALGNLPPLRDTPRVYIPQRSVAIVDALSLPSRFAVIHGMSNEASRDWDPLKWAPLTRALSAEHGLKVVEVGLKSVVQEQIADHVDLTGRLGILETAEVMRRSSLFIGIDSGPAHLANAVEAPGVILLGHYASYTRYMPYSGGYASGRTARIIHADAPASSIPVAQVMDAAREAIKLPADEPDAATDGGATT